MSRRDFFRIASIETASAIVLSCGLIENLSDDAIIAGAMKTLDLVDVRRVYFVGVISSSIFLDTIIEDDFVRCP